MRNIFKIILFSSILISQTSDQIEKAKQIIQSSGMSENQVRDAARQRGYTEDQINSAIEKGKTPESSIYKTDQGERNFNEFPEVDISNKTSKNQFDENKDISSPKEEITTIEEQEINIESKIENDDLKPLNYFGYNIFSRDPALFQATSFGVVDPDYLIGPGDEIIVIMWGETEFREQLIVNREGFVFVPEIGQIFVNGLNLNLLESKLFKVFSQSYASLNSQRGTPTTFLDVSLGNLRPLRIQVLGEVAQPGAYTVSPSATLFSALYYFNGPTPQGSLRDIQLIRSGKKVASIDFYDFLLTGKKPKDQKLQLDDVIFIPRRLKTISIDGQINRKGIYELKENENFKDLITIAGGLKITAYLEQCQIDRVVPFDDRKILGMDRMYVDINLEQLLKSDQKFSINDGDNIKIFSILDLRENVVSVSGAVIRPGDYEIKDSLKISALIKKAGGLNGDAYLERADVVRIKPDFTEELIKIDLGKALDESVQNNIILKPMDRLRIYGLSEMDPKKYVSIIGHVKKPGRYLLQENLTLHDLLFKSGGFIDEEFKKRTYLNRGDILRLNKDRISRNIIKFNLGEVIRSPDSPDNVLLNNNDVVKVFSKEVFNFQKFVTINGSVKDPGKYGLKTKMTLRDLILEAGGITEDIFRYKIEVAKLDTLNLDIKNYAEIVVFDLDTRVYNDISSENKNIDSPYNFNLSAYDIVSIRPDPYFKPPKTVFVDGEVLYPGSYVIKSSNEKILDIIKRAGGLTPNAYPEASIYSRNSIPIRVSYDKILKNEKSYLNFKVQDGDKMVFVPQLNVVQVMGAVNNDGVHKYIPKKRVKYYINLAGGLKPNADRKNIWVDYPNGESKKYDLISLNGPKVIDGSKIRIGTKPDTEPLDKTELAKELSAIIANLAQVIAVLSLAGSN